MPRIVRELMDVAQTSPDEPAFRARALQQVVRGAPVDSAIFVRSSGDPRPAHINKGPFLPLMKLLSGQPERFAPGQAKGQAVAREHGAYLDTEVYTARERRELPFYREIVRPQGITNQLVAHLRFRGELSGLVYLCRHGRGTPFRPRDLEWLRGVLPFLALGHAALIGRSPPMPSDDDRELDERIHSLSPREREIVRHVCAGLRNRDIALLLGSSPNTVRNQLHRVFERLGLDSRTALAVAFLRKRGRTP
jgi:DNA-binding CsgD family transcriptional regulator